MNSLVGYGVSSDSDSGGEDVNITKPSPVEDLGDEAEGNKKARNFLLQSTSSESDPDDDNSAPSPPNQTLAPSQSTLPAPSLGFLTSKLPSPSLNACAGSSVFANPFKAQAEQKLTALQKHVPLTMQAKPSQIGGKRICVSYRKDGRCRFGIKCKFAHDSDLQTPAVSRDCLSSASEETSEAAPSVVGASQSLQQESKKEESEGQQAKKRRVGLSNTLVPPKRALKQYTMQRDRERINMS
ncbi:uncharacterized protein PAE49_003870 [Odontesthes bonariensis]|uniref:uncharacterized protein LOC142378416 n=1 Tax=Odontesthes bonariensis TaxID=219752 RepID=UPI003F58E915